MIKSEAAHDDYEFFIDHGNEFRNASECLSHISLFYSGAVCLHYSLEFLMKGIIVYEYGCLDSKYYTHDLTVLNEPILNITRLSSAEKKELKVINMLSEYSYLDSKNENKYNELLNEMHNAHHKELPSPAQFREIGTDDISSGIAFYDNIYERFNKYQKSSAK